MQIELPFQMDFVLNLTFRCNLRCKMCTQYGDNFKDKATEEMEIEYWLRFLEEIKEISPKPKIILMGGEPFLYKDFTTLFRVANDYKIKTHIITNGFYLDKYIDTLKVTDTDITISIDGLNDIHDTIRCRKGLFKKVVNNIELIDKCQKEGSKIKFRINQVMLPQNISSMVEFHKFFNKFNVDTFTFQHLQSSSDTLNNLSKIQWKTRLNQDCRVGLIPKEKFELNERYANNIKSSLYEFKKYCRFSNCFVFPALEDSELVDYYTDNNLDGLRKKMICTTPWLNPTINPNGDVSNCIHSIIGNIKEDSFWDIWNNEKAQQLRDNLVQNGKFTICTKCCCFYKGNFVHAPDGKIEVNNIKMRLPDEINYIQSSKRVAFIKDNEQYNNSEYIPAIPINVHTNEMLREIGKRYEIITIME